MDWFNLKEKAKFLWHANNAHGLHSPFVFDFYNAVKRIARSPKQSSKKLKGFTKIESRIIWAIICHLEPKNTLILDLEADNLQNELANYLTESRVFRRLNLTNLPTDPSKFSLIILSKYFAFSEKELLSKLLPFISNESAVIIPHIHASKEAIIGWKRIINEKEVQVSMDLFFVGLVFFRKESSKQDFQLRF